VESQIFTILLSNPVWAELDRLAAERHCSTNDLTVEVARRMLAERDFFDRAERVMWKIIRLRHAGQQDAAEWPRDPLDCLAVSLRMSFYIEQVAKHKILTMPEEDLDYWNREVKRTGRSFEYLISQTVCGPQPDKADHS
jgi:hypothetical protein